MTVTLNSSSSRQLTSISFSYLSGVLSCFFCLFVCFVWNIFFSIFILPLCFYVLYQVGKLIQQLGLEKVALFSCGALISMSPMSPEPGGLEEGLVQPLVVAGPQVLWTYQQARLVSGLLAVRPGHNCCRLTEMQGKALMWLAARPTPTVVDTLLCAGAE